MAVEATTSNATVRRRESGWRDRLRSLRGRERFGLAAVAVLLVLAVIGPEIAP